MRSSCGGLALHVLLKELIGVADSVGDESLEIISSKALQGVESGHNQIEGRNLLLSVLQVFLKDGERVRHELVGEVLQFILLLLD